MVMGAQQQMAKVFGQLSLPSNFAEQLLQCQIEMELSESIRPQVVTRLIELYATGLQYHESLRSYKYLYFQRKMNLLVKSPRILNELNSTKEPECNAKSSPESSPSPAAQQLRLHTLQIRRQHSQLQQKIASTLCKTSATVKDMVIQSDNSLDHTLKRIHQEIDTQQEYLRLKLQARKGKSRVCLEEKATKDTLFNESQEDQAKPTIQVDFKEVIDQ